MGGGGGGKDIYYAFFGNVVRGEIALFRLVVRNGFAHFVRKVFARRNLLPGKFWVFLPLIQDILSSGSRACVLQQRMYMSNIAISRTIIGQGIANLSVFLSLSAS